ncbi:MAG: putative inorganic carbon transporter subunit DabA [Bryobacteraceae bacterium]
MKPHNSNQRELLRSAVQHAAHLLPMQGPIGVFIHHNTLHAFQHLPFEEAVLEASRLFGTEPYMSEAQFRADFERGRIFAEDLDAVLAAEPNPTVFVSLGRRSLRRVMLHPGLLPLEANTVRWELEEGILLRGPEDRQLFEVCFSRTDSESALAPAEVHRQLRDSLLAMTEKTWTS